MKRLTALFLLLTLSSISAAQNQGFVLKMQLPAWIERDGQLSALRVDQPIYAGDVIVTGSTGRALVDLPDNSDLKIGSNARFAIQELSKTKEPSGDLVEALMEISKGSFRYTTRALGQTVRRAFRVKVGLATVGIRGTDFWGEAAVDKDTVVLLEGSIDIEKAGQPIVQMDEPLQVYIAPKNGPPEPLAPVDMDKLNEWAASVEATTGNGVIGRSGRWAVYLGSFSAQESATQLLADLDTKGYPAEILENGSVYRVGITGFLSYEDAKWLIQQAPDLGIQGAWLQKI